MMTTRKFHRREYENAALVAVRESRLLTLFWARRCRKSTTLGSIAFDEMSQAVGRTVIAASASLLLGTELVGMTLTASEQAAIVTGEATAMQSLFEQRADGSNVSFKCANAETQKVYGHMKPEDFADLYKSSKLEMRLYFDRSSYSRLKVIAPNPATARGWAGTVLRDEAGYTSAGLENDLRIATKPIIDTDPSFKLIYASNLCPDDRHPFFEMTMPPADLDLPVNPMGNFYRSQTGALIHRVTLADAYSAGHVLFDDKGKPLTYEQFCALPGNKLGLDISYKLNHVMGGAAAIDLLALLTAQTRGARQCAFVFVADESDFRRALDILRELLGEGPVGVGFDVATTTGEKSNPSSVTVTERVGTERVQRLVVCWKERKESVQRHRIRELLLVIRNRPAGGPARRLCIDASSERLFADGTSEALRDICPVEQVVSGAGIQPPGYEKATNYKTHLGDLYCAAVNENHTTMPGDRYVKDDHRLVLKTGGAYQCEPDNEGRHGDTFDSGKLAEWALSSLGGYTFVPQPANPLQATRERRKEEVAI